MFGLGLDIVLLLAAGAGLLGSFNHGPGFLNDIQKGIWAQYQIASKTLQNVALIGLVLYAFFHLALIATLVSHGETSVLVASLGVALGGLIIFLIADSLANASTAPDRQATWANRTSTHTTSTTDGNTAVNGQVTEETKEKSFKSGPKNVSGFFITLVILPITTGLFAYVAGPRFYSWVGEAYFLFLLAGTCFSLIGVWRHSETAYAPYVLTFLSFALFAFFMVQRIAPQHLRSMDSFWTTQSVSAGKGSLEREIANSPVYEVTADTAFLYSVKLNKQGEVISKTHYNGSPAFLKFGQPLKLVQSTADSVDIGSTAAVQILLPDNNGEFVLLDGVIKEDLPWVDASKIGITQVASTRPILPPTASDGTIVISSTSENWAPICANDCTLTVSGQLDYGGEVATPDSSPRIGDSTAKAKGIPFGVLIAKIGNNGKPFKVGSERRTIKTGGKTVYAVVNDSDYRDNKGFYTISKL